MAIGVIDELLVGLGFDYDPKDLEQFNDDISDVTNTIKAFAKVVVAGTAALIGFATATTAAAPTHGTLRNRDAGHPVGRCLLGTVVRRSVHRVHGRQRRGKPGHLRARAGPPQRVRGRGDDGRRIPVFFTRLRVAGFPCPRCAVESPHTGR